MPDIEYEPFLTMKEAAEFTGYAVSYIGNLVANGEIPCHRRAPGAVPRFLRSELAAWMKGEWTKASV